jgi:hypothetical protein
MRIILSALVKNAQPQPAGMHWNRTNAQYNYIFAVGIVFALCEEVASLVVVLGGEPVMLKVCGD